MSETGRQVFQAKLATDRLGLLCVDTYGFITRINEYLLRLLGFDGEDLVDKPLRVLLPELTEQSGEQFPVHLQAMLQSIGDAGLDAVSVDGSVRKFQITAFESGDHDDQLVLLCHDITPINEIKATVFRQQQLLSAEREQVADAILHINHRGSVLYANPVGVEMLRLGNSRHSTLYVDDVLKLKDSRGNPVLPFSEVLARDSAVNLVHGVVLASPDGSEVPVMVSATPIRDAEGGITSCVIVMRAINESRRISSKLSWHETHDPLTQLANRRQMETELVRAIESARVDDTQHALLYIDLYNFSMINDTCGLSAGDELLRQIARLLSQAVGDFDVVGRIGNDEFAILLWQADIDDIRPDAERIMGRITQFNLPWNNRRLRVGVSMGVEIISRESASEVEVMLSARGACEIARDNGRNRIHFPNIDKSVKHRHTLSNWASAISEALDDDRFVVYCQPIVPLGYGSPVKHYEVLVRMLDKNGKIVAPANFIPAAESYGFIDDIDRWVFDHILTALQGMSPSQRQRLAFAVNLSGNTISDENFLDYVVSSLRQTPLEPGILQFEITETSAVKHFDRATRFINALQEFGCRFALDDFGSGLSSFGYLKQLPVNYLKIDGSFISKMESEDVEYSMVSTIHNLAKIMGLQTIAECVENPNQARMLKELGIDYGQGFYFAVPEPLEKILAVER
jgi:diguanylate cyclase (GGDEF)-like protein